MKKNHAFLRKMLAVSGVFYCASIGYALADSDSNPSNDPKIRDYFESFSTSQQYQDIKICGENRYLASCGSVNIGTNWLKGMKKTTLNDGTITTPDYYSYNAPLTDTIHMTNLRKFFGGYESIIYDGNTVTPEKYTQYKNQILSNFCTNGSGVYEGNVECKPCPNGASVASSSVKQNTSTGKIFWDTWDVHTIADCYMNTFSDDTGDYVYVPSNTVLNEDAKTDCYYSTNVSGTTLTINVIN